MESPQKAKALSQIGPWRLEKTIGRGSTGKVKAAFNAETGEKRACKVILASVPLPSSQPIGPTTSIRDLPAARCDDSKAHGSKEFRIIREAAVLLLLDHPHVIQMHEMHMIDAHFYLFFELVSGGQMLDFIISHGRLKEKQARKYARQLVSAVDYCHQNSIVHRDLKIENILIDKDGAIKLIDFGLSNLYTPTSQLNTFCGSLYFAAPELLAARSYTGPEVDIWSLGIIFYVLVCGHVPFDDNNIATLHAKIRTGIVEYPNYLSSECRQLISMMLQPNPGNRCSMEDIKCSNWLTKGYDGPPDNFLPPRSPLESVNPEVVKRMKGFGFGSDEEITSKLTEIALKSGTRSPRAMLGDTSKTGSQSSPNPTSFFGNFNSQGKGFDVKGLGRALIHRSERGSIAKPSLPESSLLSIYYLVHEKMEREQKLLPKNMESLNISPAKGLVPDERPAPSFSAIDYTLEMDSPVARSESLDGGLLQQRRRASMDNYVAVDATNSGLLLCPRKDIVELVSDEDTPHILRPINGDADSSEDMADAIPRLSVEALASRNGRRRGRRRRAASMGELSISEPKTAESNNRKRRFRPVRTVNKKFPSRGSKIEMDVSASADEVGFDADVDGIPGASSGGGRKQMIASKISAVKKRITSLGSGKNRKSGVFDPPVTSPSIIACQSPPMDNTDDSPIQLSTTPPENRGLGITALKGKSEDSSPPSMSSSPGKRGKFIIARNKSKNDANRISETINRHGKRIQSKFSKGGSMNDASSPDMGLSMGDMKASPLMGDPGSSHADSVVKSVFLKGLFSVATSSSKSSASIRRELLRVFDQLSIDFYEISGSFECRFVDNSADLELPGAGDAEIGGSMSSFPQSPPTDDDEVGLGKTEAAERAALSPKVNWKRCVVFEVYIVKSMSVPF